MTGLVVSAEVSIMAVNHWRHPQTELTARMCADCGYTEFHAKNSQAIWEDWSKQNH